MDIHSLLSKYVLIKRGKKSDMFYIDLVNMYQEYPKTCCMIIRNLYKLGCWQDYYYLLRHVTNIELKNYIYTFLHSQLLKQNEKKKGNISRWLPREKSRFDIKLNFVDEFCLRAYPNVSNKFKRRNLYRKMNAKLCKDMDLIVFNIGKPESHHKANLRTLIRYYDRLDPNSKSLLVEKLSNISIFTFGKLLIKKTANKKLFIQAFNDNIDKFRQELTELNLYHPTLMPLLDTSIGMAPYLINAYMIIFVNDYNKISINFKQPYIVTLDKDMNLYDKVDLLTANLMPSSKLHESNNMFVLSNRQSDAQNPTNKYWQIDTTPKVKKVKLNTRLIDHIATHDTVYREIYLLKHVFWVILLLCGIIIVHLSIF